MESVQHLKEDLPVAMTMAAFVGISWYICVELNIRLFMTFARRRGLYFWSCLLCSWGVLTQPLATILTDFAVWKNKYVAMVIIYFSWLIMVVPQSFVLYSRLYLVMSNTSRLRWVFYSIIVVSVIFAVPTMVFGIIAVSDCLFLGRSGRANRCGMWQQTTTNMALGPKYLIWDKIQLTVFFVQETVLSLLYIFETRKRLKESDMLHHDHSSREVFRHLIWVNLLVIFLDCSLLALSYADFFYVQSAYKPCVYGVKLRVEFAILNRLIASVQRGSNPSYSNGNEYQKDNSQRDGTVRLESFSCRSERSNTEMIQNGNRDSGLDITPYEGTGVVRTTEISVQPTQKGFKMQK
jgi:hypothetical protein